MSSIFPLRDTVTRDEDREPRLVDLDEETADEVFEALSSGTTREIFLALHREPQTASDLAEETDTSVQNVQYHLGKLDDAALVEVVDTWYSERGTEMSVYGPQDDSLVLFAGRDKQSTLRSLLDRVAGVFAVLVPVSILAGLSAHVTTDTEEGDPIDVETGGPLDAGTDDVTAEDDPVDADVDTDSDDGFDTQDGDVREFDLDSGQELFAISEDNTLYVYDREAIEGGELVAPEEVDETTDGSTVILQGDGIDIVPVEAIEGAETTTTVAGMDPALAVGVGVLLGGLAVAGGLAAWYGLSGRAD